MLLSGPAAIPQALAGRANSRIVSSEDTRAMLPARASTNQISPSGPRVMAPGLAETVGTEISSITPAVVIRPILLASGSVNQRRPSAPATIPRAFPLVLG